MASSTARGTRRETSPPDASSARTCVEETSGMATPPSPYPPRWTVMMRASCCTRSNRFHCGFSASRSVPSTSAQRVAGCFRWSHSRRSTVRAWPDSCSARETLVRGSCAAGEQVDGRLVLDELVSFRPPAELRRVLCARVHDGRDSELDGVQPARVRDVDLHAVAALPLVFVPGGREGTGAEGDPFEPFAGKIVGEPLRIEPGRADQLEGTGGAPPLGEIGPLEQAH